MKEKIKAREEEELKTELANEQPDDSDNGSVGHLDIEDSDESQPKRKQTSATRGRGRGRKRGGSQAS